jgi:hypothetical protein
VRGIGEKLNSADVILSVHGFRLKNQIFLPTGAMRV